GARQGDSAKLLGERFIRLGVDARVGEGALRTRKQCVLAIGQGLPQVRQVGFLFGDGGGGGFDRAGQLRKDTSVDIREAKIREGALEELEQRLNGRRQLAH
ncbi:MAG TPA: hypothetical protein VGC79_10945, partial [Polyangiaceae bacterium]